MKNEENLAYFLNEAKTIKTRNLKKKLRVAFLASFAINGFEETIRVKCFQKGIDCITYVGDYNQYNQEILNQKWIIHQPDNPSTHKEIWFPRLPPSLFTLWTFIPLMPLLDRPIKSGLIKWAYESRM